MKHGIAVLYSLISLVAAPAVAQPVVVPLPPMNLGGTSFEDGMGGVGDMLHLRLVRSDAGNVYDATGDRRDIAYDKSAMVQTLAYAHVGRVEVLGGNLGAEVAVQLIDLDLRVGSQSNAARGVGNPGVGVFVQWRDKRLFGYPFSSRLSMLMAAPLGNYDSQVPLNLASDYYSFDPYYAFTLRPDDAWEISGRLMYLWNGKSDDPEARFSAQMGKPVHQVQPGQAIHYNLSASYALNSKWRIGLGMYQLQQVTADRVNGIAQPHSKEAVVGFGPGVQWRSGRYRFIGHLYGEGKAQNRSAGTQLVLRYIYVF